MNKSKGYKVRITETLEKDVYIIADSEELISTKQSYTLKCVFLLSVILLRCSQVFLLRRAP